MTIYPPPKSAVSIYPKSAVSIYPPPKLAVSIYPKSAVTIYPPKSSNFEQNFERTQHHALLHKGLFCERPTSRPTYEQSCLSFTIIHNAIHNSKLWPEGTAVLKVKFKTRSACGEGDWLLCWLYTLAEVSHQRWISGNVYHVCLRKVRITQGLRKKAVADPGIRGIQVLSLPWGWRSSVNSWINHCEGEKGDVNPKLLPVFRKKRMEKTS